MSNKSASRRQVELGDPTGKTFDDIRRLAGNRGEVVSVPRALAECLGQRTAIRLGAPVGRVLLCPVQAEGDSVGLVRLSSNDRDQGKTLASQAVEVQRVLTEQDRPPFLLIVSDMLPARLPLSYRADIGFAIELMLSSLVGCLAAHRVDRLTRNMGVAGSIRTLVTRARADFVLAEGGVVDLADAYFEYFIKALVAMHEAEQTDARTARGIRYRLSRGLLVKQRATAYGIIADPNGIPVVCAAELSAVFRVLDLVASLGFAGDDKTVAGRLASEGVELRGRVVKPSDVARIVNEYGYVTGEFTERDDGGEFELRHVALPRSLSPEQFDENQHWRAKRQRGNARQDCDAVPLSSVGSVTCGNCGGLLSLPPDPGGRIRHRTPSEAQEGCEGFSLSLVQVQDRVFRGLRAVADATPDRDVVSPAELSHLRARLNEVELAINCASIELPALVAEGHSFAAAVRSSASHLHETRAKLVTQVKVAECIPGLHAGSDAASQRELAQRVLDEILGATDAQQRRAAALVLRACLSAVVVYPDGVVELWGHVPDDGPFGVPRTFPLRAAAEILWKFADSKVVALGSQARANEPRATRSVGATLPEPKSTSRPRQHVASTETWTLPAWTYVCDADWMWLLGKRVQLHGRELHTWMDGAHGSKTIRAVS